MDFYRVNSKRVAMLLLKILEGSEFLSGKLYVNWLLKKGKIKGIKEKIRKAIIPAAGLGTRFLPATKAQPKEMLPIVDKPTIQYIIEEAIASGIEEILIITGRSKKCIEDHFDKSVELEL